jgi:hypothetical protein
LCSVVEVELGDVVAFAASALPTVEEARRIIEQADKREPGWRLPPLTTAQKRTAAKPLRLARQGRRRPLPWQTLPALVASGPRAITVVAGGRRTRYRPVWRRKT